MSSTITSTDVGKHAADVAAVGAWLAWIADLLPAVATLFTIVWLGYRIYQTRLQIQLLKKGKDVGRPSD